MSRNALIYSGTKWQEDIFNTEKYRERFGTLLHVADISEETLNPLDAIIIPRESNQEALLEKAELIRQFVENGKTIVSFGEISVPWLPDADWYDKYPKFKYNKEAQNWDKGDLFTEPYKMLLPEHPILKNLVIEDLQWHFHGVFKAPETAEVLVEYGDYGDVLYIDSKKYPGTILATTLDPIVHAGYGVVKKTQKFLDSVLDWLDNKE
ncbi:MAG TPA: hypothetical protein PK466_12965 [Thermotogota bacterium]|nr:hypothetical protein [Thermotogota bacterium]HPR97234.1 hypothetical protein [Thermotogota bacterium]